MLENVVIYMKHADLVKLLIGTHLLITIFGILWVRK